MPFHNQLTAEEEWPEKLVHGRNMPNMVLTAQYENMPMQYTEIFKAVKNENFQ